jgi:hypothetical protein
MNKLFFLLLGIALCAANNSVQAQRAVPEHSFGQYAVPVFRGRPAQPDFKSFEGSYEYRTRLREGVREGVNFAGHYAIVAFGCGGDCLLGFLVDVRSGKIFDLPLGGEENYSLSLDHRPTSRLLKARWIDTRNDENWFEHPLCVRQEFLLNGNRFKLLTQDKHRVKDEAACFPE